MKFEVEHWCFMGTSAAIGLLIGAITMLAVLTPFPTQPKATAGSDIVVYFGDAECRISGPGRERCLDTLIPTMLDNYQVNQHREESRWQKEDPFKPAQ